MEAAPQNYVNVLVTVPQRVQILRLRRVLVLSNWLKAKLYMWCLTLGMITTRYKDNIEMASLDTEYPEYKHDTYIVHHEKSLEMN